MILQQYWPFTTQCLSRGCAAAIRAITSDSISISRKKVIALALGAIISIMGCERVGQHELQASKSPKLAVSVQETKQQLIVRERRVVAAIAESLRTPGATALACGTRASGSPRRFLVLSAEHCWGCRDVGRVLRKAPDTTLRGMWIGTTVKDSAQVCNFAFSERVAGKVPVFVFANALITDTVFRTFVVLTDLDSSGNVTGTRAAVRLTQLIPIEAANKP